MQGAAVLQFNIPQTSSYSFLFTEWTGKKKNGQVINPSFAFEDRKRLTSAMLLMLADIRDGSVGRERPIKKKHKYFCDKFGLCKKTVMKYLAELEARGLIERCGRSRYRVIVENLSKSYILIEDYYFGQKIKISGNEKRLTFSAVVILEYICSIYYFLHKQGKPFVRSLNKLASALNYAPSTVSDAVQELTAAGLIKRYKATPVGGYADNIKDTEYIIDYTVEGVGDGYSLTAFVPDEKLLENREQLEEEAKKKLEEQERLNVESEGATVPAHVPESALAPKKQPQKKGKQQKLRKLSKTKRAAFISAAFKNIQDRKYKADYLADCADEEVRRDSLYKELNSKIISLQIKLGTVIARGDLTEAQELEEQLRELNEARTKRLSDLGRSEADLKPKYHCRYCDDEGYNKATGRTCRCVEEEANRLAKLEGFKI